MFTAKCPQQLSVTQEQFVKDAMNLEEHPFNRASVVPDATARAIFTILTRGPEATMQTWRDTVHQWWSEANHRDEDEKKLIESLKEPCKSILRGKRMSMMRRVLARIRWPDSGFIDDILEGFSLIGDMPSSSRFSDR